LEVTAAGFLQTASITRSAQATPFHLTAPTIPLALGGVSKEVIDQNW